MHQFLKVATFGCLLLAANGQPGGPLATDACTGDTCDESLMDGPGGGGGPGGDMPTVGGATSTPGADMAPTPVAGDVAPVSVQTNSIDMAPVGGDMPMGGGMPGGDMPPMGGDMPAMGGEQPGGSVEMLDTCDTSTLTAGGLCNVDGSSNFAEVNLTYSGGYFSGTILTNTCNRYEGDDRFDILPSCYETTIPVTTETPAIAPLEGSVGFTFFGESINGPLDMGLREDDPMQCPNGVCTRGTDLVVCVQELWASCTDTLEEDIYILGPCGGHADNYHYHEDLVCHYDSTATDVHSPVVGAMLDGRGLYGRNEGSHLQSL